MQQWLTAKPLTIVTTFFILDVCGGPGNNRNSRKRCSIKKNCSEENFPIFREKKTCTEVSFKSFRPTTLLKRDSNTPTLPENIQRFLKTPF